MTQEIPDCPNCNNQYLAIRTDIYKDKREFIYCDQCGSVATRSLWVMAALGKEVKEPKASVFEALERFALRMQGKS